MSDFYLRAYRIFWRLLSVASGGQPAMLCLLIGLQAAGYACLLLPGLPLSDDIYFHLHRLESLAQAFQRGHFTQPIDAAALAGAGYGQGLFYCDLPLYPVALLRALGLPLVPLVKVMLLCVGLGSGLSAFLCALRVSRSSFGGLVAGLLYGWSSYLATDIFNRFALGEILCFPLVPLALLGWHECVFGDRHRWPWLAFSVAGVLFAHHLTFLQLCLALALLTVFSVRKLWQEPRRLLALFQAALLALGCTACYLAPLLEQLGDQLFTVRALGPQNLAWRALPPWRLLIASWLDTRPTGQGHAWCPPGLGLPLVVLTLIGCWRQWRSPWLWTGLLLTWLTTSLFPWSAPCIQSSFLASFQFPWRFLLLSSALLALSAGCTMADEPQPRRWLPWLVVACGCIWGANVIANYQRSPWRVRQALPLASPEAGILHYLPACLTEEAVLARVPQGAQALTGAVDVSRWQQLQPGVFELQTTDGAGCVELPLVYYRGYQATDSAGRRLPVTRSPRGFVCVDVSGAQQLTVQYAGTGVQRAAWWTSGACLLLFCLWKQRKKLPFSHLFSSSTAVVKTVY